MTFSTFEFHGGSNHFEFTDSTPTYTIVYGDTRRVLFFTESSLTGTVTVNLPDATKIDKTGFLYFLIVNNTSFSLDLRDFDAGLVTSLGAGECGFVGVQKKPDAAGDWFVDTNPCVHEPPPDPPPPTVSFGGEGALDRDTWLYQHITDTWSQGTDCPGDVGFAQAVNTLDLGDGDLRSFHKHLFAHFEYTFDTHSGRQQSAANNQLTGSARLRDGTGLITEMYLSWSGLLFENLPEIYDPNTDAWATVSSLLNPFGSPILFDLGMTAGGALSPNDTWWAYLLIGKPETEPDTAENHYFHLYDSTINTHFTGTQGPIPLPGLATPNRSQVSMVHMSGAVHVLGGSTVVQTAGVPLNASNIHLRYTGGGPVGSWAARPQIPVAAIGQGVEVLAGIESKLTFGMGESTSGLSALHRQYDEVTQTYISRSTAAWGSKDDREGSWCVANLP